ncbi:MAG: glucose-6-phosphate dehydrogenase, partial [Candidatus Brocadiia bacterium]
RTEMSDEQFRERLEQDVGRHSRVQPLEEEVWRELAGRIFYQQGAYAEREDHAVLKQRLEELDEEHGTAGNRTFYLAVPPEVVEPILDNLSAVGALRRQASCPEGHECYMRVAFEKPFGWDLESARRLNRAIETVLDESQVFRMDHYLGKETVQNITVLRFANSIFEHIWHAESVDWIRVTVAEDIGVEGRGGYFEQAGILRDIMQNHVLQLLSLITMEPPPSLRPDAIRDEKVKVLRCLHRLETPEEVRRSVVRGQYGAGTMDGRQVPAYRDEEGVDPESTTETFVGVRTRIDNWRWAGVPVYLTAGKRLSRKLTEVAVQFKEVPVVLFGGDGEMLPPNRLTIRVQPDEGVSLRFVSKVPGLQMELRDVEMDFPYESAFPAASPEAYERLLLAIMAGQSALFTRRDEVELAWEFAGAILDAWEQMPPPDFPNYRPGTWGPISSEDFFAEHTDYSEVHNPARP